MSLKEDLEKEVGKIFKEQWNVSKALIVPDPQSLRLSNDARHFERATVLYADLAGSTYLVNNFSWSFAGEVYKSFLTVAAKIVRTSGAEITAYDGDRIMALFTGDNQTTVAAKCGLQINWAVQNIVNPGLKTQYPDRNYLVKQVVGIDTSELRAARIGVRGDNDLVWIGRAANYAAKLTECRNDYPTWITKEAYQKTHESSRVGGRDKESMWKEFKWTAMNDIPVYGSNWTWSVN